MNSGYYGLSRNAAQFTGTGPVVSDNFEITGSDTIPNHGDILRLRFTVRNESLSDSVYDITSRLVALDSCTVIIGSTTPEYGNIAPGEFSTGDREQIIRFMPNCPDSIYTKLRLKVFSNGSLFRSDTISIFVTRNPTELTIMENIISTEYALQQNHPNPFNPVTRIGYHLPERSFVNLAVFNVLGRQVAVMIDGNMPAG